METNGNRINYNNNSTSTGGMMALDNNVSATGVNQSTLPQDRNRTLQSMPHSTTNATTAAPDHVASSTLMMQLGSDTYVNNVYNSSRTNPMAHSTNGSGGGVNAKSSANDTNRSNIGSYTTTTTTTLNNVNLAPEIKVLQWVHNPVDGSILHDHKGRPVSADRILATNPLREELSSRKGPGGKTLTYMSGDGVSRTLNDIFGYDGWDLTIQSVDQVGKNYDKSKERFEVIYIAHVRVTHKMSGTYREDVGCGDSVDRSYATAVGHAIKASITDALKRAARHFGDKLGGALYGGNVTKKTAPTTLKDALDKYEIDRANSKFGFPKDQRNATAIVASQAAAKASTISATVSSTTYAKTTSSSSSSTRLPNNPPVASAQRRNPNSVQNHTAVTASSAKQIKKISATNANNHNSQPTMQPTTKPAVPSRPIQQQHYNQSMSIGVTNVDRTVAKSNTSTISSNQTAAVRSCHDYQSSSNHQQIQNDQTEIPNTTHKTLPSTNHQTEIPNTTHKTLPSTNQSTYNNPNRRPPFENITTNRGNIQQSSTAAAGRGEESTVSSHIGTKRPNLPGVVNPYQSNPKNARSSM